MVACAVSYLVILMAADRGVSVYLAEPEMSLADHWASEDGIGAVPAYLLKNRRV